MKLLRELKIYRMEEIDTPDDDYDDYDLEIDDEDADSYDPDIGSSDEFEPAASGPDPDEQEMMDDGDSEFSDDFDSDMEDDEFSDDFDDDGLEDDLSDDDEQFGSDDEFSDEFEDDSLDGEDDEFEDDEGGFGEESQDQNYQGNVRSIPGAFLVYKREAEDSTFEELWLYNVGKDIKHEMKLRRAILDGTDISPQTGRSKDNTQTAKLTSLGNVQFLNLFGLPN
jgi:hypothetical protein